METTDIDVLVVGAGVTGLASAMTLAGRGLSVCVLEAHPRPGMETSTHNSGVIHAGLYYPPGTLKAKLCLEGRDALYEFCERHGVPHRRTGKLVIASDPSQEPELEAIAANARANGARAEMLSAAGVAARQPGARAAIALWSPDTGIIDASQLVIALAAQASEAGAMLLPATPLRGVARAADRFVVDTAREQIRASVIVNAGGLYADDVSTLCGGEAFRIWPCRGDYAEVTKHAAAGLTVPLYPLPDPSGHGLGVHLTPTTGGTVLLGPTMKYQESKSDYESERPPLEFFLEAAKLLMPTLKIEDLRDGGSGIRAKLHPPEERFADFLIRRDARQPGLVHAAGIDSPGLTSCLAIGKMVAQIV